MSSILSDFHSLKENQQPESGILVQHSQVQQSSASLQPESGVLGRFPFTKKFRKFRLGCKWNRIFRFVPPENFRKKRNS